MLNSFRALAWSALSCAKKISLGNNASEEGEALVSQVPTALTRSSPPSLLIAFSEHHAGGLFKAVKGTMLLSDPGSVSLVWDHNSTSVVRNKLAPSKKPKRQQRRAAIISVATAAAIDRGEAVDNVRSGNIPALVQEQITERWSGSMDVLNAGDVVMPPSSSRMLRQVVSSLNSISDAESQAAEGLDQQGARKRRKISSKEPEPLEKLLGALDSGAVSLPYYEIIGGQVNRRESYAVGAKKMPYEVPFSFRLPSVGTAEPLQGLARPPSQTFSRMLRRKLRPTVSRRVPTPKIPPATKSPPVLTSEPLVKRGPVKQVRALESGASVPAAPTAKSDTAAVPSVNAKGVPQSSKCRGESPAAKKSAATASPRQSHPSHSPDTEGAVARQRPKLVVKVPAAAEQEKSQDKKKRKAKKSELKSPDTAATPSAADTPAPSAAAMAPPVESAVITTRSMLAFSESKASPYLTH